MAEKKEKNIILPTGEKLLSFSISPRGDLIFLTKKRMRWEEPQIYNIFGAEMDQPATIATFSSNIEKIVVIQES